MPGFATHICCEGACQTNLKTLPTPRAAHHLSLPSRNPCLVFSRAVHGVLETRVLEPTVDPTKVHHLRNFFCKFHCGTSLLVPFLQPWNIVKTWCEHFWNWSSEGRFSIEQKNARAKTNGTIRLLAKKMIKITGVSVGRRSYGITRFVRD